MNGFVKEAKEALIKVILQVVIGADSVEIINDGNAAVFTKNGNVKYITVQEFGYEDEKKFYCNRETFSGEVGVLQLSPAFAYLFNREQVKKRLDKYRNRLKKNKNGDWEIDITYVRDLLRIVGQPGKVVDEKDMDVATETKD